MDRYFRQRKRFATPFKRTAKRGRFAVRRRRRFSRTTRGKTYTNRASFATSVGTFGGRRTSVRRWRNMLWNDTIAKQHYRSVFDITGNFQTPNNLTQATINIQSALPNNFWTAAAGAKSPDTIGAIPTFTGDITLRGGIARIAVSNRVNPVDTQPSDPVRVTIFAVWTDSNTQGFLLPTGQVETMWDPSLFPDFTRFGKVLFKRETILKGDGESIQCYFKFKPQKIDQPIFNLGGHKLIWFILASQLTNTEADGGTPETLDFVLSHNVSFSADAV